MGSGGSSREEGDDDRDQEQEEQELRDDDSPADRDNQDEQSKEKQHVCLPFVDVEDSGEARVASEPVPAHLFDRVSPRMGRPVRRSCGVCRRRICTRRTKLAREVGNGPSPGPNRRRFVQPMKNPPHPGGLIRREIIEPLGLSVSAAAEILGVSRQAVSLLINERTDLSSEMALRIEKAFGPKMDHLMRMQLAYDLAQQRNAEASIKVKRYEPA